MPGQRWLLSVVATASLDDNGPRAHAAFIASLSRGGETPIDKHRLWGTSNRLGLQRFEAKTEQTTAKCGALMRRLNRVRPRPAFRGGIPWKPWVIRGAR